MDTDLQSHYGNTLMRFRKGGIFFAERPSSTPVLAEVFVLGAVTGSYNIVVLPRRYNDPIIVTSDAYYHQTICSAWVAAFDVSEMSVSWGPVNPSDQRPYGEQAPRIFFTSRRDAQQFMFVLCNPSADTSERLNRACVPSRRSFLLTLASLIVRLCVWMIVAGVILTLLSFVLVK
ncbi:hypothetical protein EIP91_009170 [Steccherinum ochraceum]|uniref:Uncharacterized protein n=1 Tax=Steccherinum ochraceum TaxID=92696 RepID=A0A4R0R1Y3_9APHY|nr:hypothetical protein EIP91_009170 [Steccherinum ochraceum]